MAAGVRGGDHAERPTDGGLTPTATGNSAPFHLQPCCPIGRDHRWTGPDDRLSAVDRRYDRTLPPTWLPAPERLADDGLALRLPDGEDPGAGRLEPAASAITLTVTGTITLPTASVIARLSTTTRRPPGSVATGLSSRDGSPRSQLRRSSPTSRQSLGAGAGAVSAKAGTRWTVLHWQRWRRIVSSQPAKRLVRHLQFQQQQWRKPGGRPCSRRGARLALHLAQLGNPIVGTCCTTGGSPGTWLQVI